MPTYHFHRLPEGGGDADPVAQVLYDDAAAARRAMGEAFPHGCDIWQGHRYVGRFHGAVRPDPAEASADPDPITLKPVVTRG